MGLLVGIWELILVLGYILVILLEYCWSSLKEDIIQMYTVSSNIFSVVYIYFYFDWNKTAVWMKVACAMSKSPENSFRRIIFESFLTLFFQLGCLKLLVWLTGV